MRCRYDREADDYFTPDGQPCRRDDYGDPTRHCTARRTCSEHIAPGELSCARCVGRTKIVVRRITDVASLMPTQAIRAGVDSDAANMAGPGVDPRAWSERRVAMQSHLLAWEALGRITDQQYVHARTMMDDDDQQHPYVVLTRWHMMFAEDYGHPLPARMTTSDSGAYLIRHMNRVAQDPEQDFPLFRREMRDCASLMDNVIRNGGVAERGAPCPDCTKAGRVVRLVRKYGHWCTDEECTKLHYLDDSGDRWVCPHDAAHWMTPEGYAEWLRERQPVGA